jgi:hypothetical protein
MHATLTKLAAHIPLPAAVCCRTLFSFSPLSLSLSLYAHLSAVAAFVCPSAHHSCPGPLSTRRITHPFFSIFCPCSICASTLSSSIQCTTVLSIAIDLSRARLSSHSYAMSLRTYVRSAQHTILHLLLCSATTHFS